MRNENLQFGINVFSVKTWLLFITPYQSDHFLENLQMSGNLKRPGMVREDEECRGFGNDQRIFWEEEKHSCQRRTSAENFWSGERG